MVLLIISFTLSFHKLSKENRRKSVISPENVLNSLNGYEPIPTCKSNFLVVLIPSRAESIEERFAIRNTWVNKKWTQIFKSRNVQSFFLFGLVHNKTVSGTLISEQRKHNDILIGDFKDSYENLTLKILFGLEWVTKNCLTAEFVLKTDEDTFVLIPNLLWLLTREFSKDRIIGHVIQGGAVKRTGRWKVDYQMYPQTYYPSYVHGNSYVIPTSVVKTLVKRSKSIEYILPIEDAFITGILRQQVQVKILHHSGFACWLEVFKINELCSRNGKISVSNLGSREMFRLWNTLLHFNNNNCII